MDERNKQVFKVVHAKDGVETVYLVHACSGREASSLVLDSLYQRTFPIDPKYTQEQLDNDPFGLLAHVNMYGTDRTNRWLMQTHGCSISAAPFQPDPPYRLYVLDTRTGEVS